MTTFDTTGIAKALFPLVLLVGCAVYQSPQCFRSNQTEPLLIVGSAGAATGELMALVVREEGLLELNYGKSSWCRELSSETQLKFESDLEEWARVFETHPGSTGRSEAHRSVLYASLHGRRGPWTFWKPGDSGAAPHLEALHGVLCDLEAALQNRLAKRLRKGIPELARARQELAACDAS